MKTPYTAILVNPGGELSTTNKVVEAMTMSILDDQCDICGHQLSAKKPFSELCDGDDIFCTHCPAAGYMAVDEDGSHNCYVEVVLKSDNVSNVIRFRKKPFDIIGFAKKMLGYFDKDN